MRENDPATLTKRILLQVLQDHRANPGGNVVTVPTFEAASSASKCVSNMDTFGYLAVVFRKSEFASSRRLTRMKFTLASLTKGSQWCTIFGRKTIMFVSPAYISRHLALLIFFDGVQMSYENFRRPLCVFWHSSKEDNFLKISEAKCDRPTPEKRRNCQKCDKRKMRKLRLNMLLTK